MAVTKFFEWRKIILQYFSVGGKVHWVSTREQLFASFGAHIEDITSTAFDSLLNDNLIERITTDEKIFYCLNWDKLGQIREEIFSEEPQTGEVQTDIIQDFDKNFTNMIYQFESETDRNLPNKGKYFHFTKKNDDSFWVSVVKTKGSSKSRKLVLGTLGDPVHRFCRIRKSIIRVTRNTGNDTFIKKQIEDDEPQACGNTRQYSRAALDILKYLGCVIEISSKGKSPVYAITDKIYLDDESFRKKVTRQITFDEIFRMEERDANKLTSKTNNFSQSGDAENE